MSDLLSSASLLLTLIAMLYGLWYQELVQAIDTVVETQAKDRGPGYARASSVYRTKAIPLFAATAVLTLVFAPECVKILINSGGRLLTSGWRALLDYDAVSTSLVLVNLGSALFGLHLFSLVRRLRAKVQKLNPKTE